MSPIAVILVGAQIFRGDAIGVVVVAVVLALCTAVLRSMCHTELTSEGVELWWFRRRVVPWQHIGAVELSGGLGEEGVKVFDAVENRSRRLPAPRGAFGVGRREASEARDLIEQWWVANRGTTPQPVQPQQAPVAPDLTFDPYAPPKDD